MTSNHFWSHIAWAASDLALRHSYLDMVHKIEVAKLDPASWTNQNVGRLDVHVSQAVGVQIGDHTHELVKNLTSHLL